MTDLLLKLFIPRLSEQDTAAQSVSVGTFAGKLGLAANLLLFLVKLIAGILSGSIAVIADALNNLSDGASSLVTLLGFRMAGRPADQDHPFGHARAEYVTGFVVSCFILFMGFDLIRTSAERIIHPTAVAFSFLALGIMGFAVLLKLWMWRFFTVLRKRTGSLTLRALALDCRNDAFATAGVILAMVLEQHFSIPLDGVAGLLVSLLILWSGYNAARDTLSPLLGRAADRSMVERITEQVLCHEEVLGFHDLLIHDYGPGRCYASLHLELKGDDDPFRTHRIIDAIEREVQQKCSVDLVIHFDPVSTEDAEEAALRDHVAKLLQELDPCLSVHDLRLVQQGEETVLYFDVSVPFALMDHAEQYQQQIEESLDRPCVIRFDGV